MLLQLWRAKWLMFLVFTPIALIGVVITLLAPTKYSASIGLIVRAGPEYALGASAGGAARLGAAYPGEGLQAEAEVASSPVLAERVISATGLSRLYPNLAAQKLRVNAGGGYRIDEDALEAFARDFDVGWTPKSAILRMTYRHADPALAAETLNRYAAEYTRYRQEVLSGGDAAGLGEQRGLIEARLAEAAGAMADFLARNGLTDFPVEEAAARTQFVEVSDELSKIDAALKEAEARLASLAKLLASTPRQIDLPVDTAALQERDKLRLQRDELLTRYLPDSQAVQDLERRIAQLDALMKAGPAQGARRTGPNPAWQALSNDKTAAAANLGALTARSRALMEQKRQAEAKIAMLAALSPEYLKLRRNRDALETSAADIAQRELAETTRGELALRAAASISVYEPARAPTKADGGGRLAALAAALAGLLAALVAGLVRAVSVSSFPTAGAIERTLGLRVLAAARDRSP